MEAKNIAILRFEENLGASDIRCFRGAIYQHVYT